LKDKSLTLVPRHGHKINALACHWVLPRSCQRLRCQRLILFLRTCLETPKAGSGPINPEEEPLLVSSSAVSLPVPFTYYDISSTSKIGLKFNSYFNNLEKHMHVFNFLQRCGQGVLSSGCDTVSLSIWFLRFCDNIRNMLKEWTKIISNYYWFSRIF
jgi:hypothetical protein